MRAGELSSGWYDASALQPEFVEQWTDLYEASLSPNVYLSPEFVLTALDTFCDSPAKVACIGGNGRLDALAVLERRKPSLNFPAASHGLFNSLHSLQTGILVRSGIDDAALDAFMRSLFEHSASALYFEDFCLTTETARKILQSAQRQNLVWHETYRYDRAVLHTDISQDEWAATLSKKTRKEAARTRRRLEEIAPVSWRFVPAKDVSDATIETFLQLEHNSWKGEQRDSLLSDPKQAEFFRRVVAKLREKDCVFFTELVLDREVIASTVNFTARDMAFAFKVASKTELAKFAPGIMNEMNFVEYVAANELPFRSVGSGARSGSYIEALWPDRMPMASGYLLRGLPLRLLGALVDTMRRAKRSITATRA